MKNHVYYKNCMGIGKVRQIKRSKLQKPIYADIFNKYHKDNSNAKKRSIKLDWYIISAWIWILLIIALLVVVMYYNNGAHS
jgi:hypothetical protein